MRGEPRARHPAGVDRFGLQRARRAARELMRQVEGSSPTAGRSGSTYGAEDVGCSVGVRLP